MDKTYFDGIEIKLAKIKNLTRLTTIYDKLESDQISDAIERIVDVINDIYQEIKEIKEKQ